LTNGIRLLTFVSASEQKPGNDEEAWRPLAKAFF